MDPQIKRRMTMDVKVYPCTGTVDGDKQFGTPINLKGYISPKYGIVALSHGEHLEISTMIIMDGVDWGKVAIADEVELSYMRRTPVKSLVPYTSLTSGIECFEVLL